MPQPPPGPPDDHDKAKAVDNRGPELPNDKTDSRGGQLEIISSAMRSLLGTVGKRSFGALALKGTLRLINGEVKIGIPCTAIYRWHNRNLQHGEVGL